MDQVVRPIGTHRSVDRPVRCLFCGAISAWWACGCGWAQRIRDEKLPRPRTVVRDGVPVIELCEELREAAGRAGVITGEYHRESARNHGVERRAETRNAKETAEIGVSCLECGGRFRPRRTGQEYCSAACRLKAHRRV